MAHDRGETPAVVAAVFRTYSASDALRSDRSARDRQRHRHKVREAIRENIADIVAEEAIIDQRRDKIIKVPIRGIKEYRFVYGDQAPGVGTGTGDTKPGQVVGQIDDGSQQPGQAGNERGVDYYETDVTLAELIEIVFEDLELPDMERKRLREAFASRPSKPKGHRRVGIRARLDKRRTALARIRRRLSRGLANTQPEGDRFPFHRDDLKYRRMREEPRPQSSAVVLCIMDTSGSMDTMKKYLARSFFFLLYQFVRARYENVDVVFIAHDTEAREVTEDEFFRKGESGGTRMSSGYAKALEIVQARYHPELWNIYAFHCSDGDNFADDNDAALKAAEQLCEVANLFGYGEIRPVQVGFHTPHALEMFRTLKAPNFQAVLIERAEDIWPNFKAFLSRERQGTARSA